MCVSHIGKLKTYEEKGALNYEVQMRLRFLLILVGWSGCVKVGYLYNFGTPVCIDRKFCYKRRKKEPNLLKLSSAKYLQSLIPAR